MSAPGRFKPTITKEGQLQNLRTYQQRFSTALKNANLSAEDVLWGILAEAKTLDFRGLQSEGNQLSLGAIAVSAVTAIGEIQAPFPIQPPAEGTPINPVPGISCTEIAEGIHTDEYVASLEGSFEHREALTLNLVWTLCENAIYQGDFVPKLINQLVISGLFGFKNLASDSERTEFLFQKHLNIHPYDYFLVLYGLWSVALKNPLINRQSLLKNNPREKELLAVCDLILAELGKNFDQYRVEAATPYFAKFTGKSQALALLSRWPLMRLNTDIFATAQPFLKIQLSSKFLTKALALARIEEKKGDTQYSQFLGEDRLEVYFAVLCDIWSPKGGHYPEYYYRAKSTEKSADRIAFEKHGSSIVCHLIQVKMKSLTADAHYGVSMKDVMKNLESGLARLISQSVKFLVALEDAEKKNNLNPEHEKVSRAILAADKFCLVGVVPDMPGIFIFNEIREKVVECVEDSLTPHEKQWFDANFATRCIWHIMELTEFQIFLCLRPVDRDLNKRLSSYLMKARVNNPLLDAKRRMPRDFRNFLIMSYGDTKVSDGTRKFSKYPPGIDELWQGIQSDLGNMFFGSKGSGRKLMEGEDESR